MMNFEQKFNQAEELQKTRYTRIVNGLVDIELSDSEKKDIIMACE